MQTITLPSVVFAFLLMPVTSLSADERPNVVVPRRACAALEGEVLRRPGGRGSRQAARGLACSVERLARAFGRGARREEGVTGDNMTTKANAFS